MAHLFLSPSHLENLNSPIRSNVRSINNVVERSNRWPHIHEVELNRITIQDLGIKTHKVEGTVADSSRITYWLDSTEIK